MAGEAGIRPYVYVERVDDAFDKVAAHGGELVTAPYPEGDLWVATFSTWPGTYSASGSAARGSDGSEALSALGSPTIFCQFSGAPNPALMRRGRSMRGANQRAPTRGRRSRMRCRRLDPSQDV